LKNKKYLSWKTFIEGTLVEGTLVEGTLVEGTLVDRLSFKRFLFFVEREHPTENLVKIHLVFSFNEK
jgi:hypothetical protein